jgi:hypothetical protein
MGAGDCLAPGARPARKDPGRPGPRVARRARRGDEAAGRGDRLLDVRVGRGGVSIRARGRHPGSRRRAEPVHGRGHRRGDPPAPGKRHLPRAPGGRQAGACPGRGSAVTVPVPSLDAPGGLPALARGRARGSRGASEARRRHPGRRGQDALCAPLLRDPRVAGREIGPGPDGRTRSIERGSQPAARRSVAGLCRNGS